MAKKLQFVSEAVKKAQAKLQLQKKSLINLPPTKQALVRRALIAKNNRLRSKAVEDSKNRSDELKKFKESQGARWGSYWNTVRNEKKNRREDWFLGPLAPMRDSGIERYTYGTTSSRQVMGTAVMEEDKTKNIPFVKGDRVVVISGRQKGKISTIVRIDVDSESAVLEGLEEYDIALPKWMQTSNRTADKFVTEQGFIPLRALRLVVPLPDPDTGILKDVVVKSMEIFFPESHENYVLEPERYIEDKHPVTGERVQRYIRPKRTNELTKEALRKFDALPNEGEPYYGGYYSIIPKFARFIEGLDIPIPWPEAPPQTLVDNDIDTLRIEVETFTFEPSLKNMPMPPSVLDELRNRRSRTRTRHEDWYIEKKEKQAAREDWMKSRTLVKPDQSLKMAKIASNHEYAKTPATREQRMRLAKMITRARTIGTTYDMATARAARRAAREAKSLS